MPLTFTQNGAGLTVVPRGKKVPVAGKAPSRTYSVKLAGKVEVPPGPPAGSGKAVVTLRGKSDQVCWTFSSLKGISKVNASHIHKAPKGKSGPVVVAFFTGALKTKGCVTASKSLIAAIAKSPSAYYVNIHTAKYPAGAIRGQL